MSAPYFKVGEEVILVSEHQPESNGDYTVTSCRHVTGGSNGHGETDINSYLYGLDGAKAKIGHGEWWESGLRKKHQGGEDFGTLMNNLKSPITQGA